MCQCQAAAAANVDVDATTSRGPDLNFCLCGFPLFEDCDWVCAAVCTALFSNVLESN